MQATARPSRHPASSQLTNEKWRTGTRDDDRPSTAGNFQKNLSTIVVTKGGKGFFEASQRARPSSTSTSRRLIKCSLSLRTVR